ncbi:MAG: DUF362 domain-containing protein [Planctomycetota bacterium]|jgi:uncharacterized protein (DUF362 family)/NAD-dependent dihydropyrimidine dehydrogenase PreA subunit
MPAAVALVRCGSYDRNEVEDALARALDLLGNPLRPVSEGQTLLLKPNLLFPARRRSRVNTDPEIVRAAARLLQGPGSTVGIGDSPGIGSAVRAARTSGLQEAMAGIPVEWIEFNEGVKVPGRSFKTLVLDRSALETGTLINLAKLKTHGQMGMTMAVKNLFGCVPGFAKAGWHLKVGEDREAFGRLLVEIAGAVPARLHVLDAVVAMEGNGPGSGTSRPLGILLVSTDAVALDRVACELVRFPPEALFLFEAAREIGLGETDLKKIARVGDDLGNFVAKDFRLASPARILATIPLPHALTRRLRGLVTPAPHLHPHRCTGCGRCTEVCPAKALVGTSQGPPRLDRARCVRCMCCQEVCEEGAIRVRRRWRIF